MSKISEQAAEAFLNKEEFTNNNTKVSVDTNGAVLYLHGHPIAESVKGDIWISTCGWDTVTTKSRLNAIPGVHVYHHKNVMFLNGKEWNGKSIKI